MSQFNVWALIVFVIGVAVCLIGYSKASRPSDDFGVVVWFLIGAALCSGAAIAALIRFIYLAITGGT